MKAFYTTTTLALGLLAGAGFLLWNDFLNTRDLEAHPQRSILEIKTRFESRNLPLLKVNSEEIRREKETVELIEPALVLPHTESYPRGEIVNLYRYAEACKKKLTPLTLNRDLQKALIWQEYVCGYRPALPETFFKRPPFMHPTGQSYVLMAARLNRSPFNSTSWILSHLRYAHILENPCGANAECSRLQPLRPLERVLTPASLRGILAGDTLIESSAYLFISHETKNATEFSSTYFVYSRLQWQAFLSHQPVSLSESHASSCLLLEGTLCWAKNSKRSAAENFRLTLLFSAGLVLLTGTLVGQIIRRNVSQRRASNRRTFVLQMLTHEIRTPATALQLSLETLRSEFDQLPLKSQEAFLRICDQTQKLSRVIDASKNYLVNDCGASSVKFKTQALLSINSLFEAIVEKYGDGVDLQSLAQDRAGTFDRYWIELCLNNLIDNALAHGKPPVTVVLSYVEESLVIDVRDDGVLKAASIGELAIPFKKDPSSSGLGLGLVLVQKITQAMNGELSLTCAPTTFSIKIRDLS